jgi:hypothetical protein
MLELLRARCNEPIRFVQQLSELVAERTRRLIAPQLEVSTQSLPFVEMERRDGDSTPLGDLADGQLDGRCGMILAVRHA